MRLPLLFRREKSDASKREKTEEVEKVLTGTLRSLATALTSLANTIERRRLARAGYEKQEKFLERTDRHQK